MQARKQAQAQAMQASYSCWHLPGTGRNLRVQLGLARSARAWQLRVQLQLWSGADRHQSLRTLMPGWTGLLGVLLSHRLQGIWTWQTWMWASSSAC